MTNLNHLNLRPAGQPKILSFPGPDWTGPKSLGLGHVFKNIFGSGLAGDKDFGPVQVGVYFFPEYHIFFPENFKNKVELNGNHALHSQPE